MKKINFIVSALVITMLASCGKSTGGYNTNTTTSDTTHEHDYNMAGLCSCGDYLGRQLTFDEAYANEVPTLDVIGSKVYFSWDAICKTQFYVDEDDSNTVPSSTPSSEFTPLFSTIEVYKDGDFTTNVIGGLDLNTDIADDGDEKYYFYHTNEHLDQSSKYYCVITLAKPMETIDIYIDVVSQHDCEYNWVMNDEGTARSSTGTCVLCSEQVTTTETAVNEVTLPRFTLESGKSFRDNIMDIAVVDLGEECDFRFYGVEGYANIDLLVDSHLTYKMMFYIYSKEHYFFPSSFILRDYLGYPLSNYTVSENGYAVHGVITVSCE
ncbi:MAG: hypothetical protein MJ248_06155 [Bacilli bacterium]|nr:hypothetical protein [Bacilli bacterium]